MRERPFSSSAFPAASCAVCGTLVLTHLGIDAAGEVERRCVQCDRPITTALEEWTSAELEQRGYTIGAPRARASGGCGGGCGRANKAS